jgi:hypothetical protein
MVCELRPGRAEGTKKQTSLSLSLFGSSPFVFEKRRLSPSRLYRFISLHFTPIPTDNLHRIASQCWSARCSCLVIHNYLSPGARIPNLSYQPALYFAQAYFILFLLSLFPFICVCFWLEHFFTTIWPFVQIFPTSIVCLILRRRCRSTICHL